MSSAAGSGVIYKLMMFYFKADQTAGGILSLEADQLVPGSSPCDLYSLINFNQFEANHEAYMKANY